MRICPAPKCWCEHLRSALLTNLGFAKSPTDPCLLHEKDMLLCSNVDNCGLASPDRKLTDNFVDSLKQSGFDPETEDDFESCLGIGAEKFEDRTCHVTQKGVIKKVMSIAKLKDHNPNWCLTSQVA